jgi:hypothetical protein
MVFNLTRRLIRVIARKYPLIPIQKPIRTSSIIIFTRLAWVIRSSAIVTMNGAGTVEWMWVVSAVLNTTVIDFGIFNSVSWFGGETIITDARKFSKGGVGYLPDAEKSDKRGEELRDKHSE